MLRCHDIMTLHAWDSVKLWYASGASGAGYNTCLAQRRQGILCPWKKGNDTAIVLVSFGQRKAIVASVIATGNEANSAHFLNLPQNDL